MLRFLLLSYLFLILGLGASARAESRLPRFLKMKDGVELFVKDWGRGPAVVFVHGWPLNADMWDYHANFLNENGFRTIAYDKRGFGRSGETDGDCAYDKLADDLAAVIDATGEDKVVLVGYSMGGGELVRYLSKYGSKKVEKIVLIATIVPGLLQSSDNPKGIPAKEFEGIKQALKADRATFLAGLFKDVLYDVKNKNTIPVTPEVLDWSLHMAYQASLKTLVACVDTFGKSNLRSEMSSVTMPALILHGTNDKPVPVEITGQDAAKRIKKSKLVLYKGASHGVVVTERDRVAKDLLEFLK